MRIKKAFILAAGLGTRLKPFSDKLPKPAFPFFDAPIAAHLLRRIHHAGVSEFVVNLHHLPDLMREALIPFIPEGVKVHWSVEERILGTGGALYPWTGHLGDGPFFLANADTHRDFSPADMALFHEEKGAFVTLSLDPLPPGTSGPIEIDEGGRIVKFLGASMPGGGKAARTCDFTGVHLMEPGIVDAVEKAAELEEKFCINMDVHRRGVAKGLPYFGYLPENRYWSDMGTPKTYLSTHFHFLEKGALPEGVLGRLILSDATTPEGGEILAPSFLGEGARVEKGAKAGPFAVLSPGALVKAGGELAHAVLWAGEGLTAKVENGVVSGWGEILKA